MTKYVVQMDFRMITLVAGIVLLCKSFFLCIFWIVFLCNFLCNSLTLAFYKYSQLCCLFVLFKRRGGDYKLKQMMRLRDFSVHNRYLQSGFRHVIGYLNEPYSSLFGPDIHRIGSHFWCRNLLLAESPWKPATIPVTRILNSRIKSLHIWKWSTRR